MNKELVREQFGASAAAYAVSKVHAQGASLARLVELVQPQAHWQVLDVATGAGHTALAFAPHVAHVTATDITPEMLSTTAQLVAQKGLANITIQEADAEALPFAHQQFDLVTCRIAPHHFGDVDAFLGECWRVLQPGGLLAVVDNVVPGSLGNDPAAKAEQAAGDYINAIEKARDPSHVRCLSLAEWLARLGAAEFAVLHTEVAAKAIELIDWAQRMSVNETTLAHLRSQLLNAPPAVTAFLQPVAQGADVHFQLAEAILIGQAQ
jgi:ubiquinone/menaquinone biosynthesis C-methylase UbiE